MSFYLNSGEIQLRFQSVLICFELDFISVNWNVSLCLVLSLVVCEWDQGSYFHPDVPIISLVSLGEGLSTQVYPPSDTTFALV